MGICNISLVETFLLKLGYINLGKARARVVDVAHSLVRVDHLITGKKFRNFLYPLPSLPGEIYPLRSVAVTCESLHLFLSGQNKCDAGF